MSVLLRPVVSRVTGQRRIAAFRAGAALGYVDWDDLARAGVVGSTPVVDVRGYPLLSEQEFDAVSRARAGRLRDGAERMAKTRRSLLRRVQMEMRDKASTMIAGDRTEKEQARDAAGRLSEWAKREQGLDVPTPDF